MNSRSRCSMDLCRACSAAEAVGIAVGPVANDGEERDGAHSAWVEGMLLLFALLPFLLVVVLGLFLAGGPEAALEPRFLLGGGAIVAVLVVLRLVPRSDPSCARCGAPLD